MLRSISDGKAEWGAEGVQEAMGNAGDVRASERLQRRPVDHVLRHRPDRRRVLRSQVCSAPDLGPPVPHELLFPVSRPSTGRA